MNKTLNLLPRERKDYLFILWWVSIGLTKAKRSAKGIKVEDVAEMKTQIGSF